MKDQVDKLNNLNIPSICINSSLPSFELKKAMQDIAMLKYKIIYIAPERLYSSTFKETLCNTYVSLVAIDEAHCASEWGHDFRRSYLEISGFIKSIKSNPVVAAFTATATVNEKNDIIKILNLNNPFVITTTFNRENLSFYVNSPTNKKKFILNYLSNHCNECGIIYCNSRKNVDYLADFLLMNGLSVCEYHAGLSPFKRATNQDLFLNGYKKVMIATNAFGMGIDKPDIRFVIHYNMPKNMEGYYQEAGRAGRDGKASTCILLYDKSDIFTNKFLIDTRPQ